MAKFTATTVGALQTEIMRRANLALKNEIASTVKERLKTHVQKDVYSTYSPVEYERREESGGLVDDKNLKHKVRDRTLYVYEEAPIDGPRLNAQNFKNKPDSLARIIEEGAYNPCPFMENTQDDIDYRYADIVKLLKNRIEHDK